MPENILVVEYEPRYTDRVRQALSGQSFGALFAKDGEEAMRALEQGQPRLIVLSSVVPKVSTADLIRAIRGRKPLAETPILLTVSGYNGKSPRQDAERMGASDILPKPYSEAEFLGKVQQMLGIRGEAAPQGRSSGLDPELTIRHANIAPAADGQLTSNEIFGDLLTDEGAASPAARKPMKPTDDLDKMLADTLAGVMPQKRKDSQAGAPRPTSPGTTPTPLPTSPQASPAQPQGADAKRETGGEFDKRLQDTLSGLEKNTRTGSTRVPVPPPAPAAPPPAPVAPPASAPTAPAAAPPAAAAPAAPRPVPVPPPAAPRAAAPTPAPSAIPTPPPAAPPVAPAAPVPPPAQAKPKYDTAKLAALSEKVPVSQPVLARAPEAPAEVEEEPADGVKFGQYVLLEKIATGGMAEVWKARMRGVEGFQKTVAIKKILPHLSDNQDFIEMFVDEAKLAAQLNHNNIIHIYDLGKIQSSYYIAMEYIDGYDLKTILKKGQDRDHPMTVELALFVASKIASALDYAHRKRDFEDKEMGLVHRDVSPQNVLVSQDGDIKLCDFGIAKAASKASHTQAGALKGKLQYMSPEQAWGRHIDRRSDIFALATVLFEMLTGRKLFTGDNELSILEQVREARVTRPSEINDEVTPEIDAIVLKALQKDPERRYQTAGEMARDIDQILYSFKPTPTNADIAIHMHRLSSPEAVMHEPMPEPAPAPPAAPPPARVTPIAAAAPAVMPAPAHATAVPSFIEEPPAKKAPIVPIAIAAVILIAAGIGWFLMKGKGSGTAPPQTASASTAAPIAAPGTTTQPQAALPAGTLPTATVNTTTTSTGIDNAKVDEEVRKRLDAQRLKLEQQTRTQQAAAAAATAPRPTANTPSPAPAPVTPAPVAAAPQPVAPPVQQPVEAPRPAPTPQPAAPEAPRTREGDLVAAGSEGLTAARMTRQATPTYPPIARAQRVEGTVVMSVLVSESGQVLDVKIINGVSRPVGINESAMQTIRRSSFAPGVKDGVRVKSWTTVKVDFRL
jgi:TonB family protein